MARNEPLNIKSRCGSPVGFRWPSGAAAGVEWIESGGRTFAVGLARCA